MNIETRIKNRYDKMVESEFNSKKLMIHNSEDFVFTICTIMYNE